MSKYGSNVLVTGANRGLGLALVRYLAQEPEIKKIFAACRNPGQAKDLHELDQSTYSHVNPGKIFPIQLDVQDDLLIEAAYYQVNEMLKDEGLNLLINNAGMLDWEGSGYENAERPIFMKTLEVNTVFYPLLLKAAEKKERALVVNISSGLASIEGTQGQYNRYGTMANNVVYGMSKAAMNYYNKAFGKTEAKNGIIAVAVAPGWIQTDMGGPNASLTVDEAIPEIIKTIGGLKIEDSGKFIDLHGKEKPF